MALDDTFPKIVYQGVTLLFSYPPVMKAQTNKRSALRHDSVTLSGLRQSLWFRTDQFFEMQLDFVPQADIEDWATFIEYALQGGDFAYYPDRTQADFVSFLLEDTDWDPKFAFRNMDKFTLTLRLFVE
jgi:hypothetical protein